MQDNNLSMDDMTLVLIVYQTSFSTKIGKNSFFFEIRSTRATKYIIYFETRLDLKSIILEQAQ